MFSSSKRSKTEKVVVGDVHFLGEQDGAPEREFKANILSLLDESTIRAAFLTRVRYGQEQPTVALCLEGSTPEREELVHKIGMRFAQQFRTDVFVDIIVLTAEQAAAVRLVCAPFFQKHE